MCSGMGTLKVKKMQNTISISPLLSRLSCPWTAITMPDQLYVPAAYTAMLSPCWEGNSATTILPVLGSQVSVHKLSTLGYPKYSLPSNLIPEQLLLYWEQNPHPTLNNPSR